MMRLMKMTTNDMPKEEVQGNLLSPLPIALVGAQVNKKPNYLVIGYLCPFNFRKHILFSLYNKRYRERASTRAKHLVSTFLPRI